jgi:hypothetical protein
VTHHPVVLAPEREEVVGCALAADGLFTAPAVDLRLRVSTTSSRWPRSARCFKWS